MNEFDGKKFYGFSLHNDPALSTTTRNFEFKYARAEHLERAIQKVQHNEPDNDRNRKKDTLNHICRAKKMSTTTDVNRPYQRDADVETLVSRSDAAGRVRALSNTEINQLIDKVRSYSDLRSQNSSDTYAKGKDITKTTMKPSSTLKSILRPIINEFPRGGAIGGTYYPNMRPQQADELDEDVSCDGEVFCSDSTSEDQILCNPFELTHEPFFETHSMHLPHVRRELHSGVSKLPDVPEEDELFATKTVMPIMVEEFRQAQPKWVEICEMPAKPRAQFNVIKNALIPDSLALVSVQRCPERDNDERLPTNVTYTKHAHEMQLPIPISSPEMMLTNLPPPPSLPNLALTYACSSYEDHPSTYYVEDSDLEYEMIGRPEYTKLYGQRPNTEELTNNSRDSGGLAEFVEVEPKIPCMNLSFLKNVSPIRYSDMTDDREDDRMHQPKQPMKVTIKSRSRKAPIPITEKEAPTSAGKDTPKKKTTKPKKKPAEEQPKQSPRKKVSARNNDSSPVKVKSPHSPRTSGRTIRSTSNTPRHQKDRSHQSNTMSSNELRLMKNIVLSKSIEDLKIEKMGIFAKMRSTQEHIIETLDKLRISLLELYVPDSHYEKTRRQKNAFEFSVRFSRNFLYPLKGMIEDLRLVSAEQLCSASSNEATQRVLNIFVLIQQSLQAYYKQLRYFLLDQVPQKLSTLIELASTTINICLDKQVFDRNDSIIECLQERCSKFLGFLEDMHEERFLTARENYRKAFDKTSSNYSLKMFMNDLNMYEPKLVPKNHYNQRRKPKQRRVLKPSATTTKVKAKTPTITSPKTSHMVITKPDGDQISTHVNELGTSSGLFHSVGEKMVPPAEPSINSDDLPNLNKALIEALQTVTKEQMRQVLKPIMQTLGSVLEKKNTSKTIDELLNAFSKNLVSLAEGEQTKKTSPEQHSGNGDKTRPDDESKAAKQTEQHHSRHRHSNMESSKRDDPAAAFFGNMTPTLETAVCDVDVDDDDDNYYVDDGFENGDGVDNDDDDDDDDNDDADDDADDDDDDNERCGKESTELLGSIEPTEPTEPTGPTGELTENTDSARYFQGDTTDKSNTNTSNASNNNVVVFGNFNLCAEGNYEGDDGASESGSDFESFEGTSSQIDVVVAVKPDKNKVNEQEQARQQQQQQTQQQQQQQKQHHHNIKKDQQQQQQQQQRQNKELKQQHEALEQHKQNKQQVLRLQHLQLQQQDFQHHKSLRERAENYDTHIQQQQQLLQQQACEEQLKQRQRRKHAQSSANDKNSPEQIFQKCELQKQLENQLDEHEVYTSAQQEQRRLHQKHLKEQQTLEREEQLNLREHQKQQQQIQQQLELQQHKQGPMPPPKPVTRKQIQSQTQHQIRSAISSRHSSRASSSHPPSSSASPLPATSRGRVTSRVKATTNGRPHSQGDKINVLKKRRNPLNSPPPAPSVTPNSARTPRSRTAISSTDIGDVTRNLVSPSLRSYTNDVCFSASNGGGGASGRYGGGDADAIITPDSSQSQMFRMCSKLKPDLIDMLVPLANAFNIVGSDVGKDEQRSPRTSRRCKASTTQKSEASANHDLIEALTNCLFKLGSAEKENIRKIGKDNEATQEEGVKVQNGDSPKSLTLYTGESPYEKMKSKKSQHLQKYKSKITEKGICKDSHKVQPNDLQNESFEGENDNINCAESDYQTQINTENNANLKPITSSCTLWNANLKPAPQKKDLHIEDLIAERDHFLRLCSKNRFYTNPNFNQPWSVFSKLAARLSNDIVSMIEEDFSIGVSKFVQDFLDNETKI